MRSLLRFLFTPSQGPASILLIRLAVGLIFLTQGILKYIDPNMGLVRFTRIGFPHPYFTAHFVGTFEIVCGFLLLLGLWTRAAAVPLLIVITTAIATTKVPELFRANQGFWYMVSDARTDFAMFCLAPLPDFGRRGSMVSGCAKRTSRRGEGEFNEKVWGIETSVSKNNGPCGRSARSHHRGTFPNKCGKGELAIRQTGLRCTLSLFLVHSQKNDRSLS